MKYLWKIIIFACLAFISCLFCRSVTQKNFAVMFGYVEIKSVGWACNYDRKMDKQNFIVYKYIYRQCHMEICLCFTEVTSTRGISWLQEGIRSKYG